MKGLGKISEFFNEKQNIEIKRELLSTIKSKTAGVDEMSEEKLDKTVKIIRYTLQLYDLSASMGDRIKKISELVNERD
jgi:hypothetical protein